MNKKAKRGGAVLTGLLFSVMMGGCSVNTWYNPVTPETSRSTSPELSTQSEAFRSGYGDGCKTAHGEYTKDSERFKSSKDYYDGWFAGRSGCQYK